MNAEAFLADICEHPEDDTPRLVFADWLDDHGDQARAEFIRLQVELARLDEWSDTRALLPRPTEGSPLLFHYSCRQAKPIGQGPWEGHEGVSPMPSVDDQCRLAV